MAERNRDMGPKAGARRGTTRAELRRADAWRVDLHTERTGVFFYTYRRLSVERNGRRATVREFVFHLDYDSGLHLLTRPRRAVRQRGRSLSLDEAERLWRRVVEGRPEQLHESYPCLDDTPPEDLDDSVGGDGVPIAVTTGEEGPACLTIRVGRAGRRRQLKRVVIERMRLAEPVPAAGEGTPTEPAPDAIEEPEADAHGGPEDGPPEREPRGEAGAALDGAPLTRIVRLLEPGLREVKPFNYRKTDPLGDLSAEFEELKSLAFLNTRQFERRGLETLGRLGDAQALPLVVSELFASDPSVRLQALDALAAIGDESAVPDVELLCYDDHLEVRERARTTLELLGRDRLSAHSH